MTQSHTKDRIETVIFTPTTSYYEQPGFARERIVSFENMDELKEKLFSMYEDEENKHVPQPISSCRIKETCHSAEEGTKLPSRSILKTKTNPPGRPGIPTIPMSPSRTSPSTNGSPKRRNRLVRFFAAGKEGSKA
jgi:hypothetical protein